MGLQSSMGQALRRKDGRTNGHDRPTGRQTCTKQYTFNSPNGAVWEQKLKTKKLLSFTNVCVHLVVIIVHWSIYLKYGHVVDLVNKHMIMYFLLTQMRWNFDSGQSVCTLFNISTCLISTKNAHRFYVFVQIRLNWWFLTLIEVKEMFTRN